jgi:predicted protein tyrosine phosphatase
MYDTRFGQPINGKLLVLSKSAAVDFTSNKPWACISIGSEDGDWPKINRCQLVDVLQVSFLDLDRLPELYDGDGVLINDNHAKLIWDFVDVVWDKIDLLVIHCLAGVCRSPAVAAAIAKIKYGDDSLYFKSYLPNALVYRTMIEHHLLWK